MAWTAPMTFVSGNTLTAAQLNTYLRDNFNETAPAKATTAGYHIASGGSGIVVERPVESAFTASQDTTTSTSYVTITNSPSVTVTTGATALVSIAAASWNSLADTSSYVSVAVSGASSIAANDGWCLRSDGLAATGIFRASATNHFKTLTPGSNTFTMHHRVSAGTGTWTQRHLIVIGF